MRSEFPEFLETFNAYSYDIQRADVMRYLILLHQGGIYADLDVECLRPLDPLLAGRSLVIGREPPEHARSWRRPGMLCNAVMAGAPGHRFWRAVLARARLRPRIVYHDEVVSSTGPLLLTDVFEAYEGDDVHVVEPHVFCPFSSRRRELAVLAEKRPGHEEIGRRAPAPAPTRFTIGGTAGCGVWPGRCTTRSRVRCRGSGSTRGSTRRAATSAAPAATCRASPSWPWRIPVYSCLGYARVLSFPHATEDGGVVWG